MVNSFRIRIDGKEQDVDLKRLTVMLHQGDVNLEIVDPRVQEITPEDTLAMARHIPQELWVEWRDLKRFVAMWKSVWGDTPPPKVLAEANHAMRHTVGLFILVNSAYRHGKVPFIRNPETYLHPKQQCGLADLFNKLTNGGFDEAENSVPPAAAA